MNTDSTQSPDSLGSRTGSAGWSPAPWNCKNCNIGLYALRIDAGGLIIADVFFRHTIQHAPDEATARANARLIAAAPDLFEALVGVVKVADRDTAEFAAARAAIQKAIGKNTKARQPEGSAEK